MHNKEVTEDGIYVRLYIEDAAESTRFLIDTGACVSVLPIADFKRLFPEDIAIKDCLLANGKRARVTEPREIIFCTECKQQFKLLVRGAEVPVPILGLDFVYFCEIVADITGVMSIQYCCWGSRLTLKGCVLNHNPDNQCLPPPPPLPVPVRSGIIGEFSTDRSNRKKLLLDSGSVGNFLEWSYLPDISRGVTIMRTDFTAADGDAFYATDEKDVVLYHGDKRRYNEVPLTMQGCDLDSEFVDFIACGILGREFVERCCFYQYTGGVMGLRAVVYYGDDDDITIATFDPLKK